MTAGDKMGSAPDWRQGRAVHAGRRMVSLLGTILDPAARRRGFAVASLLADWPTIIGPAFGRRCQPMRVEYAPGRRSGGILHLHASGGAAVEVQHAAPQIVERINGYFGFPAVRRLQILQVPLRFPPPPAPPPPRSFDPALEAALGAALAPVADENLRAALLALGRAVHDRR